MTRFLYATAMLLTGLIGGCSLVKPVDVPPMHTYTLSINSFKNSRPSTHLATLLITTPTASPGYQTQAMIYNQKPYELNAFTKNQWAGPPADMLTPLVLQAIRDTGYFHAVIGTPISANRTIRLKVHLLELRQDFTSRPSRIRMALQAIIVNDKTNQVENSRVFSTVQRTPCDAPYGGVIAANRATTILVHQIADFCSNNIVHPKRRHHHRRHSKIKTSTKLVQLPLPNKHT